MKSKIFSVFFAIFALVALTAFSAIASAETSLILTKVTAPTTSNPNQDVTVTFTLNNTGDDNVDQTSLSWAMSNTNIGTWKSLPTLNEIKADELRTLSAVLNIPKFSSGSVSAMLKVVSAQGKSAELLIPITINEAPSLTATKTRELTFLQSGILNISNTGNTPLNSIELTSAGDFLVTLSDNSLNLNPGFSETITITSSESQSLSSLKFGTNTATITARDTSKNVQSTASYSLMKTFCSNGAVGRNLSITNVEFDSDGDEEDEWRPLDLISIEVEVENIGDDDVDDVFVELGLFDSSGRNMVDDLNFENTDEEEIDVGRLNDGDEETVEFKFRVPADLDNGNYKLAVKTYSDDDGESNVCADTSGDLDNNFYHAISVEKEDDEGKFIAFEDLELSPTEVSCGDTANLRMDVFNVGDEDQDQVKVNLVNRDLNIDMSREIRDDLDQGDSEKIEFAFTVPEVKDGTYTLILNSEYDFSRDTYRESSEREERILLKVIGCSLGGSPTQNEDFASVSASLDSDAIAGEELMVKVLITNLQNTEEPFIISAGGFESWAELDSISERIVNIGAGDTEEITIKLMVNADASDEESFSVEIRSGDNIETKEVSVSLDKAGVKSFDFGDNSIIWIIGAINLILVILIIVVAIRVARR